MALSTYQRVALGCVCAIPVAIVIVIALQPKHDLIAVGHECRANVFCDSGECLHRAKLNEHGMEDASWDAPGGVCTAACTDDASCPSSMTCGAVRRNALVPGTSSRDDGLRCIPRAWLD